jgi:hypothetical protein
LVLALTTLLLPGQPGAVNDDQSQVDWQSKSVSDGVTLRYANNSLFSSVQAIYVVDIDTSAAAFDLGVAVPDSRMATSVIAQQEGVLAAVNGTFFNMREGYNVHYVRVDDSLIAVTDEGEFGIRATGVFTATREVADILPWDPEREDAGEGTDGVVNRPSGEIQRPVPSILFVRDRLTITAINYNFADNVRAVKRYLGFNQNDKKQHI